MVSPSFSETAMNGEGGYACIVLGHDLTVMNFGILKGGGGGGGGGGSDAGGGGDGGTGGISGSAGDSGTDTDPGIGGSPGPLVITNGHNIIWAPKGDATGDII